MEEVLVYLNPWWKTGKTPEKYVKGKVPRRAFERVEKSMSSGKITAILGPRSAGKTILIYQMITELLEGAVEPRRILYFTFDVGKKEGLGKVLEEYGRILGEGLDSLKGKIYVFLDEIQKLDGWADEVKFWHDLKFEMKMVISGSSTHGMLRGGGESLVGRVEFMMLYPLTFREFLGAHMEDIPDIPEFTPEFGRIRELYYRLLPLKKQIQMNFEDYLMKGGYPEVAKYDVETAWNTLRTYYELIMSRDIMSQFEIKNVAEIKRLAYILAENASGRFNYSRTAGELGIKIATFKNYLYYLESALLIKLSYVYSPKRNISERKEKKLYFVDHGLRNSLVLKSGEDLDRGQVVENAVFANILISRAGSELSPEMFYWIDNNRKEVDIMLDDVPLEVKYSDNIDKRDLGGIHLCMEKDELKKGIVLTKDTLETRDGNGRHLIFLPVWLFLLMVGS